MTVCVLSKIVMLIMANVASGQANCPLSLGGDIFHCRDGRQCRVFQTASDKWTNMNCCRELVTIPGIKTRWRCPSALPYMCRIPSFSCDNDHCCARLPRHCVKHGGLLPSSQCPRRIDNPNCPLVGAVGRTTMTCRNGMQCDVRRRSTDVVDDWDWDCCKKFGIHASEKTRYRCPPDFPYMCVDNNTPKCGFDHCCTDAVVGCDKYGGLLTPVPSCPKLLDPPNCPHSGAPNWMVCMNGDKCFTYNGHSDVLNWDWGCCGHVSPKTPKCKTRLKCPSNFPYMCADPDTPHCFGEHCCAPTKAGCDPYGGLLTTCPVPCADGDGQKPLTGCDAKPCGQNAVCTEGSYGQVQCSCKNGYAGDPFTKCSKTMEFDVTSDDEVEIGGTMNITFQIVTDPPLSAPLEIRYLILNSDVDVKDLAEHRNLRFGPGTKSITRTVRVEPSKGMSGSSSRFTVALKTKTKTIRVNGCQHSCSTVGTVHGDDACCSRTTCVVSPTSGCRTCACKVGFTGNPTEHCYPIKTSDCTPATASMDCCYNASCVKGPDNTNYVCQCNPGFEGDGKEHCSATSRTTGGTNNINCTGTGFGAMCAECVSGATCHVATEVNSGKCDEKKRCIVDCTKTGSGGSCIGCVPQDPCYVEGEDHPVGKCDHSRHCNCRKCEGPCCHSKCEPNKVCTPEDGGKCHCKPGYTRARDKCVACTTLDSNTCDERKGDCEWRGKSCGTRGSAGAYGYGPNACTSLKQDSCVQKTSDCKWTGTSCTTRTGSAGATVSRNDICKHLADAECAKRPRECKWTDAFCTTHSAGLTNDAEGTWAKSGVTTAIILGALSILVCIPCVFCFFNHRRKKNQAERNQEDKDSAITESSTRGADNMAHNRPESRSASPKSADRGSYRWFRRGNKARLPADGRKSARSNISGRSIASKKMDFWRDPSNPNAKPLRKRSTATVGSTEGHRGRAKYAE